MANKEVRIRVPEHMHDAVKKAGYQYLYMNDVSYKPIYEIIKSNPETPLARLLYTLRTTQGLQPRLKKMREIAICCDLPFIE